MHYGTSAHREPEAILHLAEAFFGPEGVGLEVIERGPGNLVFAGAPGTVNVRVQPLDGASEVFLTTEGLDPEVRRFLVRIFEDVQFQDEGGQRG